MAYLDDRAWCHPKLADLTSDAFRLYINGISYSSGFTTRGVLTKGQQRTIGATPKTRAELVKSRLWDEDGEDGGVLIHDWNDYNEKRDERREADRKRKREARASARASAGQSAGRSRGQSAGTSAGQSTANGRGPSTLAARVEGSEGSDGSDRVRSERSSSTHPHGLSVARPPAQQAPGYQERVKDEIDRAFAEGGAR